MNKISYALGLGIGQQLKNMRIDDFCIDDFAQSIKDVMTGAPTAISSKDAQNLLNEYFQQKQKEESEKEKSSKPKTKTSRKKTQKWKKEESR